MARAGSPSGLGSSAREIRLERPQPFVEIVDLADLLVGQLAANLHPVLALDSSSSTFHDGVLEHQIALADALLTPGRAQRLRLQLAALLKRYFPRPHAQLVTRPQRILEKRLNQEIPVASLSCRIRPDSGHRRCRTSQISRRRSGTCRPSEVRAFFGARSKAVSYGLFRV